MVTAPGTPAEPESPFATMLRTAFVPSTVAALACAVLFLVLHGLAGGLSALFGGILTVAFFASGLLVMRTLRNLDPTLLAAAGMSVFFGQVLVLGIVLWAARQVEQLDGPATGITVLVVVLVWQAFQIVGFRRSRIPAYDLAGGSSAEPVAERPQGEAR